MIDNKSTRLPGAVLGLWRGSEGFFPTVLTAGGHLRWVRILCLQGSRLARSLAQLEGFRGSKSIISNDDFHFFFPVFLN